MIEKVANLEPADGTGFAVIYAVDWEAEVAIEIDTSLWRNLNFANPSDLIAWVEARHPGPLNWGPFPKHFKTASVKDVVSMMFEFIDMDLMKGEALDEKESLIRLFHEIEPRWPETAGG
jgi:hypothetical protein